jgi:Domain of unknown function (DUF4124)
MYKVIILLIIVLLPNVTIAGTYKCKDAAGHTNYSDIPCAETSITVIKPKKEQTNNITAQASDTKTKEAYTKDLSALQSPDPATKSCFNYMNTTENYPDPSTSKLLASRKKWVSVKDVGARQIVTIEMTSKNTAGMYVGRQSYNCLLMGDGVTVNTKPAELL